MFWFFAVPLYVVGIGMAFVLLGNKYSPRDYWNSPGPFFGSLVWPIFLPAILGGFLGKMLIGGKNFKTETRHQREVDEALHRLRLAEIEAKTTAELERALV